MAGVTGIGGVFFKTEKPEQLRDWYVQHLGLPVDEEGYVVLRWGGEVAGSTVWVPSLMTRPRSNGRRRNSG